MSNNGKANHISASSGQHRSQSSQCCTCAGCNNFIIYLFLAVSLTLSGFSCWLCLQRTQILHDQLERLEGYDHDRPAEMLSDKGQKNLSLQMAKFDRMVENGERERSKLEAEVERLGRLIDETRRRSWRGHSHVHAGGGMIEAERRSREVFEREIESKIQEIRSTHGNIINSITAKLSGWEAANAVTIKVLNRLKASLKDNEENNRSTRRNLNDLEGTLEAAWRDIDRHTAELAEMRKVVSSSDFEDFKRSLIEQLMTNEEKVEVKSRALEEGVEEALDRVERWANDTAILGGNLIELEAKLESEKDESRLLLNKTRAAFESRLQANTEVMQRLENQFNELAMFNETGIFGNLSLAVEETNLRLDTLEKNNEVFELTERVDHFVRSLLKVKKLPAEVNSLKRRVNSLDRNLATAIEMWGRALQETDQGSSVDVFQIEEENLFANSTATE